MHQDDRHFSHKKVSNNSFSQQTITLSSLEHTRISTLLEVIWLLPAIIQATNKPNGWLSPMPMSFLKTSTITVVFGTLLKGILENWSWMGSVIQSKWSVVRFILRVDSIKARMAKIMNEFTKKNLLYCLKMVLLCLKSFTRSLSAIRKRAISTWTLFSSGTKKLLITISLWKIFLQNCPVFRNRLA